MRAITPTHELKRRLVEQGRIRLGVKGSKGQPQKLKTLRFTSADTAAILRIADLYGGTVTPWPEAPTPGQTQVTIEHARIPILLPPDPLAGTPVYEAWSGGGCLRRCDGLECTLALAADASPDAEPAVLPCPCRAENNMICKPRTRLNVVLREIQFGGTWRVESTGWNAAEELPGMVELVMGVQERGLVCGLLGIGERMRLVNGRTKRFVVPELSLPESIDALAAGSMSVGALGPAMHTRAALSAPADVDVSPAWYEDDDVVDGEIVPDVGEEGLERVSETAEGHPSSPAQSPRLRALHAGLRDVAAIDGVDLDVDRLRHGLVLLVTKGRTESSNALTASEQSQALALVEELLTGDRRYVGLAPDGRLRVSARREAS